ncbi:MAG: phage Gp37/Gp68 family protein [Eubacteriales bacterium]|nr:phage Gp37/Gp68 family protein [Eubacteriales bacterium]
MAEWNPWHGCHKYSAGCLHCYVYRRDAKYELDASAVRKNAAFDLPVRRARDGSYKLKGPDEVFTCFTSDFFLDEADEWRPEAWRMMRARPDLHFFFITKRILRFREGLPEDWGEGYPNVSIGTTCENQAAADERMPYFLSLPIRQKTIVCEPMLEAVNLRPYLGPGIAQVVAGGESGEDARLMRCDWVRNLRSQCEAAGVPLWFKQTGARFENDGRIYRIPRRLQFSQARKSGFSWPGGAGRPEEEPR